MTHQEPAKRWSLISRMVLIVARILFLRRTDGWTGVRTDTMCKNNDQLFGRAGLVGEFSEMYFSKSSNTNQNFPVKIIEYSYCVGAGRVDHWQLLFFLRFVLHRPNLKRFCVRTLLVFLSRKPNVTFCSFLLLSIDLIWKLAQLFWFEIKRR